ncbi:MAG TPA: thioredoxin family protein [Thermotogota bacterium]|nr:thioredoxin family protein [Thermotogota bacterium]HPJ88108.1 thioredoxin family protein [Thermotogota bacterium]HPR96032.1 thioredoxin family protein [Thermotogota bacterium]
MTIKILGSGCSKCKKLEANARQAIKELGLEADVVKVQDIGDIMGYGVMSTPALVVDEEVKSSGKLLSAEDIKAYLK